MYKKFLTYTFNLALAAAVFFSLPESLRAQEGDDASQQDYNNYNYNDTAVGTEDGLDNAAQNENKLSTNTSGKDQQAYSLEKKKDGEEEYVPAEIKAIKYAEDYSLKFANDSSVEEALRGATVYERQREEYTPLNIRLGSYLLAPQISVAGVYNDNIFSTDRNEKEDYITRAKTGMVLRSDWSTHAINLGVAYDAGIYNEYSDENFIDSTYTANGQVDIVQDTYFTGGILIQGKHEDRSSVEDTRGAEPTKYVDSSANLAFYRKVSRVLLNMSLSARRLDYSRTAAANNAEIDNGDRDRFVYEGTTRLAYEFKPGYQAFVNVGYNKRDYVRDGAAARDSQGYAASVGTAIDVSGTVKGEVYAGYLVQDYDNSLYEQTTGVNYGGSILWNMTPLTSVQFIANRSINETIFVDSSGYITTLVDLSVEHELLRSLLLSADIIAAFNEYEGIDRTDNLYSFGLGAKYFINRNFNLNFDYAFQMRDSSVSLDDFQRNRVMISLKAEL